MSRVLLMAHRGASHAAPENTLRAFACAADEGADGLELDVRLSADDVPVVFHDDELTRMTGTAGRVSATPWAAIRELRCAGEPIPSLAEVVSCASRLRLAFNVELKPSARPQALVAACEPYLRELSASAPTMVSSFDPRVLALLHARFPELPLALIFEDLNGLAALRHLPPVDLHPRSDLIVAERLPAWLDGTRALRAWTVDDAREARRLMALEHPRVPGMPAVTALITNRPGPLRAELMEVDRT